VDRSILPWMEDLRAAVEDATAWAEQQLALQRVERWQAGERNWSEMRRFADKARKAAFREDVVARLPDAVARRSGRAYRSPLDDLSALAEVLAHVPGEPLSVTAAETVEGCSEGWRSPDLAISIRWAKMRLTLGRDGGAVLRSKCWTPFGEGWRLSQFVVSTVGHAGTAEARSLLSSMAQPHQVIDGRPMSFLGVFPGGSMRYEAAEK
jgi:hypothetical protein